MSTSIGKLERSEPGIDVLRALAVVMMFAVHVRRIQSPASMTLAADRALVFFMDVEPYITSLFLFLAGYSVVLGQRAVGDRAKWWRKAALRCLQLYAISVLLFVMQYGVDLPDLLASSGILQAIAICLLITGACAGARSPDAMLATAACAGLVLAAGLDATGLSVSGLNAGPGGCVPLLSHACFGALVARAAQRGARHLLTLTVITLLLSSAAFFTRGELTTLHVSVYRDLRGDSFVAALLSGAWQDAASTRVTFWNHSVRGAALLLGPLALSAALFRVAPARVFAAPFFYLARLVGRHALLVYVLHLCALGVIDLLGLGPSSGAASWGLVSALFAFGAACAWGKERLDLRRSAARIADREVKTSARAAKPDRAKGR